MNQHPSGFVSDDAGTLDNAVALSDGRAMSRWSGLADGAMVCVAKFWQWQFFKSRWTHVFFWLAVLIFCATRAIAGLTACRHWSHDAFFVLDGAWRTMNGQRAQVDFTSVLGFLGFWPYVIGLWISRGTAWGFGYGQALMGLFLTIWMYFLGRNRLRDVPLAIMCLAVCLTVLAPFCPGTSAFQTSPAETYNRFGYGVLALILVEAASAANKGTRQSEFFGGISTGTLLAALLFWKITYVFSAVFLLVLLIPCKPQTRARFIGFFLGFIVVLLPCLTYYSFNIQPILAYYRMLSKVRHVQWAFYALDQELAEAAILIVFCVIAAAWLSKQGSARRARTALIVGIVTTVCGVLTVYGNGEYIGSSMSPFLAILIADLLVLYVPQHPSNSYSRESLLLLSSGLAAGVFFSGIISLGFAAYERHSLYPTLSHMEGPRLGGYATAGDEMNYVGLVNDGIDLLTRLRKPGETVMSLDFCNPFAYGLGIKPAPGGGSDLHYKHGFNERYHQSPESLFGAADLVMMPKVFSDANDAEGVPLVYGPYLESHFHPVGESTAWILYRRDDLT